ncbi:MAG: hypothetical protein JXB17_08970 [Bacteroidales bacterium]|nr:hypothetical protein [Bacteroidales bacterium]
MKRKYITFISLFLFLPVATLFSSSEDEKENLFFQENSVCLKCHGKKVYSYYNEMAEKELKEPMCENYRIDSIAFYNSTHRTFQCVDCHSGDYEQYPHPAEARFEEMWACMDCHAWDEQFAEYHFEAIDEEYQESIHAKNNEDFNCWQCHDPHSYKTIARKSDNFHEIITSQNEACLKCHSNIEQFKLLTDKPFINLIDKHDWLPNQKLHFNNVRCIECHTPMNDSLLISHKIIGAEMAVKNCLECHSKNSQLMASLYKHKVVNERSKLGFLNGHIVKDFYLVGANRNYILSRISFIVVAGMALGIFIHVLFRILLLKKKND